MIAYINVLNQASNMCVGPTKSHDVSLKAIYSQKEVALVIKIRN